VVGLYAGLSKMAGGVMDAGPWLTVALGGTFVQCWGYSLLPLKRTAPLTPPKACQYLHNPSGNWQARIAADMHRDAVMWEAAQ
jgi:hypothetical protein